MELDLETKVDLEEAMAMKNIAEVLSEDDLGKIGHWVVQGYEADCSSRVEWEVRSKEALELALQVVENKTFPWPGASNVKFPLLTIAALQYHSRAYPALVPGPDIVHVSVFGADQSKAQTDRAYRIKTHMSYQILEEDENWENNMDRAMIMQPIIGCAFKKVYFDGVLGHNVSETISAADFVVDYWTKSLETANRITHRYFMSRNSCREREVRGLFCYLNENYRSSAQSVDILSAARDRAQGVRSVGDSSLDDEFIEVLEQHCFLDLDGDGYKEPYIVYVNRLSCQVLRIVARFFPESILKVKGEIFHIKPEKYFVKYPFIPSPDGGFYDVGFGCLLAPLNESINTILNQLVDAGTMSNLGGGFLARGMRIKGGEYSFKPQEWKRVDSGPDDLRQGIFPLPIREPSGVLFQLLELLINYGERVSGSTDLMTGITPGQNTPAYTTQVAAEQGMKVFSGIFKRTYRALKEEFRMLYNLNSLYLSDQASIKVPGLGNVFGVTADDYRSSSKFIRPSADPNMMSEGQKLQKVMLLKQNAMQTPGYDMEDIEHRLLDALAIPNPDRAYPGPKVIPPVPNPKVQLEQMKQQPKMAELQQKMKVELAKVQIAAEKAQAEILHLQADAVKLLAEAKGVDVGHQIALIEAQIGAKKLHQEGLMSTIKIIQDSMKELNHEQNQGTASAGGVSGMAPQPGNTGSVKLPSPGAGSN